MNRNDIIDDGLILIVNHPTESKLNRNDICLWSKGRSLIGADAQFCGFVENVSCKFSGVLYCILYSNFPLSKWGSINQPSVKLFLMMNQLVFVIHSRIILS